jgi:2-desacetyl-2-hydroxyethyl bacteriochlorophyllide A dehydrogenase
MTEQVDTVDVPTMRAARWHARRDVRVDLVPVGEPAVGQVLVEVDLVGLCGTDVEEYRHGPIDIPTMSPHPGSGRRAPITLGHEIVGRVIRCPGGEIPVGTRVVPDVVVGCGRCWWCARHQPGLCPNLVVLGLQGDGGLADYLLADAHTCVVVPETMAVEAAVFAEPASVAVRALRKAGDLTAAGVAVVGLGTIGNLVVQLAAATGAATVHGIDPVPQRRRLAAASGATSVGDPAGTAPTKGNRGFDVVVECAGTLASVRAAVDLARPGGTVVLVGTGADTMPLPVRDIVLREKRIVGSAAHVWDEDVTAAVALLARAVLDPQRLISTVIDLDDVVADGLAALDRDPELLKVLVAPRKGTMS